MWDDVLRDALDAIVTNTGHASTRARRISGGERRRETLARFEAMADALGFMNRRTIRFETMLGVFVNNPSEDAWNRFAHEAAARRDASEAFAGSARRFARAFEFEGEIDGLAEGLSDPILFGVPLVGLGVEAAREQLTAFKRALEPLHLLRQRLEEAHLEIHHHARALRDAWNAAPGVGVQA